MTACSSPATVPATATVIPLPSPISPVAVHFPDAVSVCRSAFSAPVVEGSLAGPGMYLLTTRYEDNQWKPVSFPHQAQSPEQVKTLVCILQDREYVGQYVPVGGVPGGGAAYRITWEVRLVSWPEGKVLRAKTVRGGEPPKSKASSGDRYGPQPRTALGDWLAGLWGDRSVLFVCEEGVFRLAFSPDGKRLITRCLDLDASVHVWDVVTGERTNEPRLTILPIAFSRDGLMVAYADKKGTVSLWTRKAGQETFDGAEGRTLAGHKEGVSALAFSPDGKLLATGATEGGLVILWDAATGEMVRTLGKQGSQTEVHTLAFFPDGTKLLSGYFRDATVWNVTTGQAVQSLTPKTSQKVDHAVSPDGRIIAMAMPDGTVGVWDAATGKQVRTLKGHAQRQVESVAFSPDGKLLASGGSDAGVMLWEVATGYRIKSLSGHIDSVYDVAFSPDGSLLASGSKDGTVKLWDMTR